MAVYAERRNGRTIGMFIAEVMHLGVRVRKRFDTMRGAAPPRFIEQRAGPEACKLFEKFTKDLRKLQEKREQDAGDVDNTSGRRTDIAR